MNLKRLAVAALCALPVTANYAVSHSWYPPECCSNQDCDVLIGRPQVVPGGEFRYQNRHGAGISNPQTKIKDSPDNQTHVCIREGKVLCIFFPVSL